MKIILCNISILNFGYWRQYLARNFENKNLSVTKDVLEGADLGVYLSEELSEVIDTEIIYLKEAQSIQKIKKQKLINFL